MTDDSPKVQLAFEFLAYAAHRSMVDMGYTVATAPAYAVGAISAGGEALSRLADERRIVRGIEAYSKTLSTQLKANPLTRDEKRDVFQVVSRMCAIFRGDL